MRTGTKTAFHGFGWELFKPAEKVRPSKPSILLEKPGSGIVYDSPGNISSVPRTTNTIFSNVVFAALGGGLGDWMCGHYAPPLWWLGLAVGAIIGCAVNFIRADLAWDKFE